MLIAFSGLKGSGKDTAAAVLTSEYGFTKIAFADALREALLVLDPIVAVDWSMDKPIRLTGLIERDGYEKAKRENQEFRRLMQVFGTEIGRQLLGENVWVDILAKRFPDIANDESRYVITDCRFHNEVDFVRNNGGTVIWIERPELTSDGHASESTDIAELASVVLHNDETIEELQEDVRFMLFMRGVDKVERSTTG